MVESEKSPTGIAWKSLLVLISENEVCASVRSTMGNDISSLLIFNRWLGRYLTPCAAVIIHLGTGNLAVTGEPAECTLRRHCHQVDAAILKVASHTMQSSTKSHTTIPHPGASHQPCLFISLTLFTVALKPSLKSFLQR